MTYGQAYNQHASGPYTLHQDTFEQYAFNQDGLNQDELHQEALNPAGLNGFPSSGFPSSAAPMPNMLMPNASVPNLFIPEATRLNAGVSDGPLDSISVVALKRFTEDYLGECELRLQSPRTVETRRVFIRNLLWFLHKRTYSTCGTAELRQFFHYLMHGHTEPGGRFGQAHLIRPVRPITLKDYYISLRSFFDWLKTKGILTETPFAAIPKPQVREGIKEPLSKEHIATLLQAAQASKEPLRNVAILSFLLDTGCRASELIALELKDVDIANHCGTVLGKGNKYRPVYFGARTAEALRTYLEGTRQRRCNGGKSPENTPLFLSGNRPTASKPDGSSQGSSNRGSSNQGGHDTAPLTRSGLQQLLERLAGKCGIKASCSPHAFRRSFAVQTLRNGANVFSVQAMLGHTDLQMTQKYCALAQTDVEAQHRRFGPLDRMLPDELMADKSIPDKLMADGWYPREVNPVV